MHSILRKPLQGPFQKGMSHWGQLTQKNIFKAEGGVVRGIQPISTPLCTDLMASLGQSSFLN